MKSNSALYVSFSCVLYSLARKSVRQSTSEHTRKTNLRLQERQDAPRRRRGAHRDRPLTQEELLAEAKITAEINIRSLGENFGFCAGVFSVTAVAEWLLELNFSKKHFQVMSIILFEWTLLYFPVCRELWALGGRQEKTSPEEASIWRPNHPLSLSPDAHLLSLCPQRRKRWCWRVRVNLINS